MVNYGDGTLDVKITDGSGAFVTSATLPLVYRMASIGTVSAGDLNGDGHPDLFAAI